MLGRAERGRSFRVRDLDDEPVRVELLIPPTIEFSAIVRPEKRTLLGWSHERVTLDRTVQRLAIDREIEMSFRDRKLKRHAPFQPRRERGQ